MSTQNETEVTEVEAKFDTDVIIVGAGPIGLTLACALRHHGVSCRILEERPEKSKYSKANNVWARPQELLASIGVLDALAKNSYRIEQVNTLLNGQPTQEVEVAQVESPFAKVLYSGQDVIETTLNDLVAERGSAVERSRKVVAMQQDDEGVDVTVVAASGDKDEDGKDDADAKDGSAEQLRCCFLIGADGNEGTIRKATGLDFETEHFEHRANRQVDARLSWRRSIDPDQLWFFLYHNGFCGVLPVWGGYHRLFFLEDDAEMPDRDPTLEEIQQRAREVTGDDSLTLADPIWLTHSRFKHGVAKHYRKDRVFLAGDAGHTTLPIGGQGMNAGFGDAVALAWRLAMTLEGHAGPILLESYDEERGGEHIRLDAQQAKGFNQTVYRSGVVDAALSVAAKAVPNIGALLQGTNDLQQLSVSYPKSSLNEDHLGLRQMLRSQVPHAGDRAPDAHVTDGAGQDTEKNDQSNATNLFSHIYNPDGRTYGWSLLAFDGREKEAGPLLLAAIREVETWDWIRPRLVLGTPLASTVEADETKVLFDLDGRAHAAYALDRLPSLILIRPDGHIAFRGSASKPELLKSYCEKVFGASNGAAQELKQ